MNCSRKNEQNDVLNAKNGVQEQKISNKPIKTFYLDLNKYPRAFL